MRTPLLQFYISFCTRMSVLLYYHGEYVEYLRSSYTFHSVHGRVHFYSITGNMYSIYVSVLYFILYTDECTSVLSQEYAQYLRSCYIFHYVHGRVHLYSITGNKYSIFVVVLHFILYTDECTSILSQGICTVFT